MSDVQIFYNDLTNAASSVNDAASEVTLLSADLVSEDTGIQNPSGRTGLRLEMHRRLVALHDTLLNRSVEATGTGATFQAIADDYTDLDIELSGTDQQ